MKSKIKEWFSEDINKKKFLLSLFVLSISSIVIALLIVQIIEIGTINPLSKYNLMWVFYLFIPIPLLSIGYGFKLRYSGLEVKKNIIGGFLILILLIIFGSVCFNNAEISFDRVSYYEKNMKIELPDKGRAWQEDSVVDYESTMTKITNVYLMFDDEKVIVDFEKTLKNNWLTRKETTNELMTLLTYTAREYSSDKSYYLFYIKETKEYNVLPKENGKYHIFVIVYNKEYKEMVISDYILNYKKA